MAVFAGYFTSEIKMQWLSVLLVIIVGIESIGNQLHDVNIKPNERYLLKYEAIADAFIPKNALVLTNGEQSTTQLYFIHRKGWITNNENIANEQYLDSLKQHGLEFVFLNTCRDNTPILLLKQVYNDDCICVYSIDK